MPFQMKQNRELVEGKDIAPENIYELKLLGFKPTFSKKRADSPPDWTPSLNLNARMEIINNPEQEGKLVYELLNMNSFMFADFCHAFGLPMETDGEAYWLPGVWDSLPSFDPTKAETYKYEGPLLGRTCRADIGTSTFMAQRPINRVRKYFCALDDCHTKFPEIRHSENLLK